MSRFRIALVAWLAVASILPVASQPAARFVPAEGDGAIAASRAREADRSGECPPGLIQIGGTDFCTHGPDPAPPGLDVDQGVAAMTARAARRAAATVCDGDGVGGYRVQVLYVRVQGQPDRFGSYLPSIRAWTAGADEIMQESAEATGGSRRFRFVTQPDCALDVEPVTLPQADAADFGSMIGALEARGFDRTDRYYLAFVDSDDFGSCGIATYRPDDRPGAANRNNTGPGYSRVDAGCWDADVVAHELMHNLGGVQRSAPHSTPSGHCTDEYDVMCYRDALGVLLQVLCANLSFETRYDCHNDDYFHTNPPAGSYLDTHWNTANSRFLIGGSDPGDEPQSGLSATITSPKPGARPKGKKTVTLTASAEGEVSAIAWVEFRRCPGSVCAWDEATVLGHDRSAPFSLRWKLPKKGTQTLLAQVADAAGNRALSDPVTIRIRKP